MAHRFDLYGVSEKLFMLRQLVCASRAYCKDEGLYKGSAHYPCDDWNDYESRLKRLVSSSLIEIAAKARVLEDTLKGEIKASSLRDAAEVTRNLRIGEVIAGAFELTVRESCNKILHAVRADMLRNNSKVSSPYRQYSYWTGIYQLAGAKGGRAWCVNINVAEWAVAIEEYLDVLCSAAYEHGIDYD